MTFSRDNRETWAAVGAGPGQVARRGLMSGVDLRKYARVARPTVLRSTGESSRKGPYACGKRAVPRPAPSSLEICLATSRTATIWS